MTTTISIDDDTKARFDDLRPEGAASADEFLGVLLDHYDDTDTSLDAGAELDTEELAAEIRAELDTDAPAFDEIQRAVRTIEERTGRIEQTLEDMGARR